MKYLLIPGLGCAIGICLLHVHMTVRRVREKDTTDVTMFMGGVAATGVLACCLAVLLVVER